jgi:hypothetical protein
MKCLTVLAVSTVLACAPLSSVAPNSQVSDAEAYQWGCDAALLKQKTREFNMEAERQGGALRQAAFFGVVEPAIGWDACDLLAHDGAPSRVVEQPLLEARRHLSLWYDRPTFKGNLETHLVTLTERAGSWVVNGVKWW